jgi:hypothetical protein
MLRGDDAYGFGYDPCIVPHAQLYVFVVRSKTSKRGNLRPAWNTRSVIVRHPVLDFNQRRNITRPSKKLKISSKET